VIALALEHNSGIVFLHSHLGPGWQGMSEDDVIAEKRLAISVQASTELPLLGLTVGTDGAWSARFWHKLASRKYARKWCNTVRVVGESLRITFNDQLAPTFEFKPELSRTISAWGETEQQTIMRMKVGIVGAGSVGSIVAETLARIGVGHIKLIDFDSIEQVNLDRLLHASRLDAQLRTSKVAVIAQGLRKSATAYPFTVETYENSIIEPEGFTAALDCDVLFSCVDRPWARSVLNFISYAHLIPVIDGGIRVQRKKSGKGLLRADWRAQTVGPERPCLECLGQYNSGDVAAERDGYFDNPSYVAGLSQDHFLKHNENVFPFSLSLASQEIQHFLTLVLTLPGGPLRGPQLYHFVQDDTEYTNESCHPNCLFPSYVAWGDRTPIKITGQHQVAIEARIKRAQYQRSLRYWLARISCR
jgi:molybdopterin/thiamine biosynthesis adenylyltransferase